ncbi:uncharacterized protein [Palaemon carinicauda]|uniref:uncharacterized protein n=1 Tax=Palaemon carinicauda TaxID=392227 RepID=UPI0035B59202
MPLGHDAYPNLQDLIIKIGTLMNRHSTTFKTTLNASIPDEEDNHSPSTSGNGYQDNCPPDNCPPDNCPPDNCPPDSCPPDNCPPDNFPLSSAPGTTAPSVIQPTPSDLALHISELADAYAYLLTPYLELF